MTQRGELPCPQKYAIILHSLLNRPTHLYISNSYTRTHTHTETTRLCFSCFEKFQFLRRRPNVIIVAFDTCLAAWAGAVAGERAGQAEPGRYGKGRGGRGMCRWQVICYKFSMCCAFPAVCCISLSSFHTSFSLLHSLSLFLFFCFCCSFFVLLFVIDMKI